MKMTVKWMRLTGLVAVLTSGSIALAQAAPTAIQQFRLSAFGGTSSTFTDVLNGHNLGVTAGADLSFRPFFGLSPSLEVRGMYPFDSGSIAGEKDALIGLKFERQYGVFHPYGNALVGRGEITYQNGGYKAGAITYLTSTSVVYSPGAGVDIDLTDHWAFKGDFQYQLWTTYPLSPKILKPMVVTVGAVYRFDFNQHTHVPKQREAGVTASPTTASVSRP